MKEDAWLEYVEKLIIQPTLISVPQRKAGLEAIEGLRSFLHTVSDRLRGIEDRLQVLEKERKQE